jgi:uncharacterized protein (DUF1015 family)
VDDFLIRLQIDFDVFASESIVFPAEMHSLGMYLDGKWFLLKFKKKVNFQSPLEELDVSLIQKYIFSDILNIIDPRTDPCIDFISGILPVEILINKVESNECIAAFTLFPPSIDQLMGIADEGEIMPPKSTWFEPKFDVGLLIHHIK